MPSPPERAAEGPAPGQDSAAQDPAAQDPAAPDSAAPDLDGQEPAHQDPAGQVTAGAEPASDPPPGRASAAGVAYGHEHDKTNGAATIALVAGLLGFTGVGIVLGIVFGVVGLARSRRGRCGKARCWTGIVAALVWAAGLGYFVPNVVKAADPGCTAYKQTALPRYNRAVEDFGDSAARPAVTADLHRAIAALRAAAAKSRDAGSRDALAGLARELQQALADEGSGHVPASVMQALNADAAGADGACGTI